MWKRVQRTVFGIVALGLGGLLLSGCTVPGQGLSGTPTGGSDVLAPSSDIGAKPLQGVIGPQGVEIDDKYTFVGYMKASVQDPTDRAKAAAMLSAGITLSNRLCTTWFDLSAQRHGALTPELSQVKATTVTRRLQYANTLVADAQNGRMDYWTALRNLLDFDDQCSPLAVEKFVSAAAEHPLANGSASPAAPIPAVSSTAPPASPRPLSPGPSYGGQSATGPVPDDAASLRAAGFVLSGLFRAARGPLNGRDVAAIYLLTRNKPSDAHRLLPGLVRKGLYSRQGQPLLKNGARVDTLVQTLASLDANGVLARAAARSAGMP